MEPLQHQHHRNDDFIDDAYVMEKVCDEKHAGLITTLINMKEQHVSDETLNEQNHRAQWRAIENLREMLKVSVNRMVTWIIGAMAALIMAFGSWLLNNIHIFNVGK
jgi:hypothetical protein